MNGDRNATILQVLPLCATPAHRSDPHQIFAHPATDLVNMPRWLNRLENLGNKGGAAFNEARLRHASIQEQVAGMTAKRTARPNSSGES